MTRNFFDGQASGVVQAGHIEGGVHLHAPARPAAIPPAQVLPPPRVYTNNERQLGEITEAVRFGGDEPELPRLVVIRGPVGGGKSATVCQWLHQHRARFPDGLFHASLATSGAESECLLQFLLAVGYMNAEIPHTVQGRANLFRTWSTGKRVAVVVDDAVTGGQIRWLVPGLGFSVVLVTEAGPLGGLRTDKPTFVEIDPLTPESAKVLVTRILDDGDPRPNQESDQLNQLVELCNGYTVALCVSAELLAQRPNRSFSWLVQQLSREGRRLKTLSPNAALSLTAVLNTAVARLDEQTRRVYAAFGQHPGSGDIGVDALAAALDADLDDVRDHVDRLVDARLVQESASDRFFVTGLVRDHAREREADEQVQSRFAQFYVDRVIGAGNAVMPQRGWLERLWPELDLTVMKAEPEAWLEAERANLCAVAELLRNEGDQRLCPFAVALWPFQERAKHLDDMDLVNEHAVAVAKQTENWLQAGVVLVQRGFAFRHRGELDKAAELFAEAEEIAVRHERSDLAATAVESLGLARREQGDPGAARDLLRRNLGMALEIADPRRTALAKMHLGSVETPEAAVELLDGAIAQFRGLSAPDAHNEHKSLLWRGIRHTELGNLESAQSDLTAALLHMTDEKRSFEVAQTHRALGRHALAAGVFDRAREHFGQAVSIYRVWGFLEQAEQIQVELNDV